MIAASLRSSRDIRGPLLLRPSTPCSGAAPAGPQVWPVGAARLDAAGAVIAMDARAEALLARLGVAAPVDDLFAALAPVAPDLRAAAERDAGAGRRVERRIGAAGSETALALTREPEGALRLELIDMAAEARAERAERLNAALLSALDELAPQATARVLDAAGWATDALRRGDGASRPLHDLTAESDAPLDPERLLREAGRQGEARAEFRRGEGGRRRMAISLRALERADGVPENFLMIARELSPRREREAELRRLAATDPLTGALNRRAFFEAARAALAGPAGASGLAMIAFDLDDFKRLNDLGGHAAGDRALQALTETARANLRGGDLFGRLGGDEFAIAIPGADAGRAASVAERLRAAIETRPLHAGAPDGARLSASFGVAAPAPGETFEAALARADAALYRAKLAGRNRVRLADPPERLARRAGT